MSNRDDARDDLSRLQRALDALATDLDAIERRPHVASALRDLKCNGMSIRVARQ
jgi:hypothetical protein